MNWYDSQSQLSGGANELPAIDPGYETFKKYLPQTIVSDYVSEIQAPINAGETLRFEATLLLQGDEFGYSTIELSTPPDASGGFQTEGLNTGGFNWDSFGATSFNTPVGELSTGHASGGYAVHHINGIVAGCSAAGMVRFKLVVNAATSPQQTTVGPGSFIKIYRMNDARITA